MRNLGLNHFKSKGQNFFMKKAIFTTALILAGSLAAWSQRYEYKVITSVESIVPMGVGRSMIVESNESIDVSKISADREDGKSRQSNIKRKDVK